MSNVVSQIVDKSTVGIVEKRYQIRKIAGKVVSSSPVYKCTRGDGKLFSFLTTAGTRLTSPVVWLNHLESARILIGKGQTRPVADGERKIPNGHVVSLLSGEPICV